MLFDSKIRQLTGPHTRHISAQVPYRQQEQGVGEAVAGDEPQLADFLLLPPELQHRNSPALYATTRCRRHPHPGFVHRGEW